MRILARRLDKATIHLQLNSVMIITKARDNSLIFLTRELASWLLKESKHTTVYVDFHLKKSKRFCADTVAASAVNGEQRLKFWNKAVVTHNPNLFDFVITLGGDGTVLYASTMFQRAVPPIMSFSLGSIDYNDESELESDMSEKVKRDLCIDLPAQSDLPKLQNLIRANFFTGTNESTSTSSPDDHL